MICLLPTHTLDGRFSTQDLPEAIQLTLLSNMVVPRIVSSSMMPTIQEDDRLELGPPTSLTVGAIVVFKSNSVLVCHRVIAIDEQGTFSTRGDAMRGACELVPPGTVIGVVTGVLRGAARISLGQTPHRSSSAATPIGLTRRVRTVVSRFVTTSIVVLARLSLCRHMLAMLLPWVTVVDVLAPAPLHSKSVLFTLRLFPPLARPLPASNGRQSAHYLLRLGSWRLAYYNPAAKLLLLRQTLREAGLESFVRHIFLAL